MTASHILLQVTCFNATESDFPNFRTNWTNFRTLSEFQDISGHFLKFQEFQDRTQACNLYLDVGIFSRIFTTLGYGPTWDGWIQPTRVITSN